MDKELLHNSIITATTFTFSRSGGNGGQNVNKVNTKVYACIPLDSLQGLSDTEFGLVKQRLTHNINQNNELFVSIQEERFQGLNRQIALKRLEEWIEKASMIPKKRKKTKPTATSKANRMKIKKIHSIVKQFRRSSTINDE